ncbi:MAG: zinc dependent phospholipase C family protein [Eubacterium sp.]|nr:zinc dependent phospholipase C family protein [Eubacterium sp.]
MPGYISHYLYGVRVRKSLEDASLARVIDAHHHAYSLGMQGPDIFFYHPPTVIGPWRSAGPAAHSSKPGLFLMNLAASLRLFEYGTRERDIGIAYLAGFFGHYTLDRTCHPFVYYRSKSKDEGRKGFGRHCRLETDIDHVFLERDKGIRPSEFDGAGVIKLSPREEKVVGTMLHYAYTKSYANVKVSVKDAISAARFIARGQNLLKDPHGIKRYIMTVGEETVLGYHFMSGMVTMDSGTDKVDPCNLRHDRWRNPWGEDETNPETGDKRGRARNESFFDLVDIALDAYGELTDYLGGLCTGANPVEDVPDDIRAGYSYLTGMPV